MKQIFVAALAGAICAVCAFPSFGQPSSLPAPDDQMIADLRDAWTVKTYGEAQFIKAMEALIARSRADRAALAEARKEIETLKAATKGSAEVAPPDAQPK
jgi:tellurite resistance protein